MKDKKLIMINEILEDLRKEIVQKKKEYYELAKQLPLKAVPDYIFRGTIGNKIKLSDLFGSKDELILIHNMGVNCPYCTMWADGFNGVLQHIENKAAFAVTSPDDPDTMKKFSHERKWIFTMVSTKGNNFKEDLGFKTDEGELLPGVSTFRKEKDGKIYLTASTFFGPGDDFCSVWYFFDLLYKKDENWTPKLNY